MAQASRYPPALHVVAAFSRHQQVLDTVRERLAGHFGPIADMTLRYPFDQTRYYEPTMGNNLIKELIVFRNLVLADTLADIKTVTNNIEQEFVSQAFAEPRPLNLDPGLLTLGKFMLATTKDQAHRIYLRDGIFAEVTLRFEAGNFEPCPWTYADYRQEVVRSFLTEVRSYYRQRLKEENLLSFRSEELGTNQG